MSLQKLNPRGNIKRQSDEMPCALARVFPELGGEGKGVHYFTITYFVICTPLEHTDDQALPMKNYESKWQLIKSRQSAISCAVPL